MLCSRLGDGWDLADWKKFWLMEMSAWQSREPIGWRESLPGIIAWFRLANQQAFVCCSWWSQKKKGGGRKWHVTLEVILHLGNFLGFSQISIVFTIETSQHSLGDVQKQHEWSTMKHTYGEAIPGCAVWSLFCVPNWNEGNRSEAILQKASLLIAAWMFGTKHKGAEPASGTVCSPGLF